MKISRRIIAFVAIIAFIGQNQLYSETDRKNHAFVAGGLSMATGLGAGYCFYKANKFAQESVNPDIDYIAQEWSDRRAKRYRMLGYALTAGSVASGIYATSNLLWSLGTVGALGAGVFANGMSEQRESGSSAGGFNPPGLPLDHSVGNLNEGNLSFNDLSIGKILRQCREYRGGFGMRGGFLCGPVFFYPEEIGSVIEEKELSDLIDSFTRKNKGFLRENNINLEPEHDSYISKLLVKNGDTVFVMGDLHGSVHSLIRNLLDLLSRGYINADFRLADRNHIVLTGDYADRGRYGVEIWYILMKLSLANPGRVFLVRGNHEEKRVAELFGLFSEVSKKYNENVFNQLCDAFNYLPSAVLVGDGDDFIQVNHGGACLEPDTSSVPLALKNFVGDRVLFAKRIDSDIGIQLRWSDFVPGNEKRLSRRIENDYLRDFGIDLAKMAYSRSKIRNIFRGHLHNSHAVSYLHESGEWSAISFNGYPVKVDKDFVYTFMSCPEGLGRRCDVDGFGILRINGKYDTWTLEPKSRELPNNRNGEFVRPILKDRELSFEWVSSIQP